MWGHGPLDAAGFATGKRSMMINDCALHQIPCGSKSI
jgi:hypothetical protein